MLFIIKFHYFYTQSKEFSLIVNAEELIRMAHRRLCGQAHKEARKIMAVMPDAKISPLLHAAYDFLLVYGFMQRVDDTMRVLIQSHREVNPDCEKGIDLHLVVNTILEIAPDFFNGVNSIKEINNKLIFAAIHLAYRDHGRWSNCSDDELLAFIVQASGLELISPKIADNLKNKLFEARNPDSRKDKQ